MLYIITLLSSAIGELTNRQRIQSRHVFISMSFGASGWDPTLSYGSQSGLPDRASCIGNAKGMQNQRPWAFGHSPDSTENRRMHQRVMVAFCGLRVPSARTPAGVSGGLCRTVESLVVGYPGPDMLKSF
jgi:hypothetical protein